MRQQPNHILVIKPPFQTASHIDDLRAWHRIDRTYAPGKLHATLAPFGPDISIVDRLMAALRDFRAAPFRVGFADFRARLLLHLAHRGMTLPDYRFTPHITLSYADRLPGAFDIVPVSWLVEELLLIESLAGRHRPLVRWRLR